MLEPDWTYRTVLDGLTLPNGIGFSPDETTLYLADTFAHRVYAFDYRPGPGTISGRRVLIDFADSGGLPDGLAVDADGHLWIAMWAGSRLVRVSPEGHVVAEIPLPARQPASCAFIGDDLATLAVTSATDGLDADPARPDGSIFAVTGLPAPGLPVAAFAG